MTEPPYLLVVFGFLAAIASGAAFEASLKEKATQLRNKIELPSVKLREQLDLFTPFLGICGGVSIFLAGGLALFSVKLAVGYTISLILTALIGRLIWSQLIKLLIQLQEGGSQSIDLDAY